MTEAASQQVFGKGRGARAATVNLIESSSQKIEAADRERSVSSEDMVASQNVQGVKAWTVDDATGTPKSAVALGASKHRLMEKSQIAEDEHVASRDELDDEEVSKEKKKQRFAKNSVDTRSGQVLKTKRRKTSLAALSDIREADGQSLDEEGYSAVAGTVSNRMMERFIERVITDLELEVVDTGGLKGLVPYYSGEKDLQTFEALQEELLTIANQPESWLSKKGKRSKESLLHTGVQAGAAVAKRKKDIDQSVSLLEHTSARVRKSAHRVPDLASYFLGSQTVVYLCMGGFLAALFCLHEHNEKKRVAKGLRFDDPLNMSPMPPAMKEDPVLAAHLESLRAQKTVQ
jgi:hypothetical protein